MYYLQNALIGALLLGCIYALGFCIGRLSYPRKARRDIQMLSKGLRDYVAHYDRVPIIDASHDEQPAAPLIEVLCGAKWEVGKSMVPLNALVATLNPEGINFIPTMLGRRTVNGAIVDPWDRPYHFAIDRDLDSQTVITFQDNQTHCTFGPHLDVSVVSKRSSTVVVREPFAIWSEGADRINECGYGDDISSWKKQS